MAAPTDSFRSRVASFITSLSFFVESQNYAPLLTLAVSRYRNVSQRMFYLENSLQETHLACI